MMPFIFSSDLPGRAVSSDFYNFMEVIKGIRSSPDSDMMEKTQRAIYFSDQPVRKVFFSHRAFQEFSTFGKVMLEPGLIELAVKYCSFVLSKTDYRDFSKTVHAVSFFTISDWFRRNGKVVGQHFIVDVINAGACMPAIEKDKGKFLGELMATCCNDVFIDGFMLECFTAGSMLPVVGFLNYVDYLDPSRASSDKLLGVWGKNPAFAGTIHYREHDWLETIVGLFDEHTDFFDSVKSDTLQACQVKSYSSRTSGGGVYSTTTYGKELADWINSANGPRKYDLHSGTPPRNADTSYSPPRHGH